MREHRKKALVVFVREPELGRVKTRLVQSGLSETYVLELYKAFLEDILAIAARTSADQKFIYIAFGKEQTGFFEAYQDRFKIRYQEGETLGDRMYNAFMDCFLNEYSDIVLIGSDCLMIQPLDIEEAFKNLEHADVTLGPCSDGGYYLLGLNQLDRELFQDLQWGTDSVLSDTRKKITRLDYDCLELDQRRDMDTVVDLEYFEQTDVLRFPAVQTRQCLQQKIKQ